MRTQIFVLLLFALFLPHFAEAKVLSFRAWKARRVSEARSIEKQKLREYKKLKAAKTSDVDKLEMLKARSEQAKINIEIAKELTSTDYFVLYFGRQFKGEKSAYVKAIRSLNHAEIADLVLSLQSKFDQQLEVGGGTAMKLSPPTYEIAPLRSKATTHHSEDLQPE